MTPAAIKREIKGFCERRKNDWERAEFQSWITGYYSSRWIACLLSKKNKPPENPLDKEKQVDITKMTTEEIRECHENTLERLDLMARMALGVKGGQE